MTYTFEHDPESGAFYIRVREGDYHETIPLGEPGFGAGVDVDAEGNVLGFEFLSFEEYVEMIDHAGAGDLRAGSPFVSLHLYPVPQHVEEPGLRGRRALRLS